MTSGINIMIVGSDSFTRAISKTISTEHWLSGAIHFARDEQEALRMIEDPNTAEFDLLVLEVEKSLVGHIKLVDTFQMTKRDDGSSLSFAVVTSGTKTRELEKLNESVIANQPISHDRLALQLSEKLESNFKSNERNSTIL